MEACVMPTVKYEGRSLMMWASFGNYQVGDLVRVQGILEKNLYHRILWRNAIPSGKTLIGPGFILQQDNDPKHTFQKCRQYVERKQAAGVLQSMTWPPQLPDLSLIELLSEELDREVKAVSPSSENQLWQISSGGRGI